MTNRNNAAEDRQQSPMDIYSEWTSGVLNTLYELFKDSRFKGLPLKGISLVTENAKDGREIVRVNFVFSQEDNG